MRRPGRNFARRPAKAVGKAQQAVATLLVIGAHDLVNWTAMRDWHPLWVALEMVWGTALIAMAAWGGVMAVRAPG